MYLVIDAISKASRDVAYLLNRKIDVPPIPIETIKKQENNDSKDVTIPNGYRVPDSVVKVYGIWKIFMERSENGTDEVYVVLSAENITNGYKNGNWDNIEYRGFYTTIEEARNEISGYLD